MSGTNTCAMCGNRPADRGLMCPPRREEDRRFSDDVQPDQREPKEPTQ